MKRIIIPGPPGTGKTYHLINHYLKREIEEHKTPTNKIAYITSKSALGGLVRALSVDLAPLGISINSVMPGVIESQMTRQHLSAKAIEAIRRETPGGELVTASEVAAVILYLISKDSTGITGQSVVVDNGWSIYKNV
jgi:NAD(P)-dependent dehydrogenase (short-subunit alcohol dehydrogenase family)